MAISMLMLAVVAGPCRDVPGTWQMRLCGCEEPGARSKAGRSRQRKGNNGRRLTRPTMAQTPGEATPLEARVNVNGLRW